MTAESIQSKTDDELGLSFKDARIQLSKLLAEKQTTVKILYPEGPIDMVKDLSGRDILKMKLADLDRQIMQVFDLYTLHLFESLESQTKEMKLESKKLTRLTWWVIGLTFVLAVSTIVLVVRTFMGK